MLPKRTFAHIPAKITLLLAGGAFALASFAGAPAGGTAHQPGGPARSGRPAGPERAIPARAMALIAHGTPARRATPARPARSAQPVTQASTATPASTAKPTVAGAATPPRPRPHPGRPHPRRHHGHRQHRHRQHRARHHRGHGRRHQIRRLPRQPQRIAWSLLAGFHWAHWQFRYLNLLWSRESGWNPFAKNPYSGAYGIPQALPASKMASAGPDWRSSARTQILWGMGYIESTYVTPFRAWLHEVHYGWY